MLKRKLALVLIVGGALSGLGVASALADNTPAPPATTTMTTSPADNQDGVDEQGAANDVAAAAADVQTEAESQAADDQSGDQQDANDQSEEAGDTNDNSDD
jgi:hypothetical protein